MENVKESVEKTSRWLKDYMNKSGMKGFVLGLSGGIDSAVSLGIAIKAVGKENVRCFALPCTTTFEKERKEDVDDAKLVADHFGVKLQKIRLDREATTLYRSVVGEIENAGDKPLVLANIKARLRMTTLRALAESLGYLVLGTTNKTEEYLGYYTKAGDGGAGVDIEPLADYLKYEIRELAVELRIPEKIITKSPSAGLFDNQTDEAEIGFKYDDIDSYLLIREEYTNINFCNRYDELLFLLDVESAQILFKKIKDLKIDNNLIDRVEKMIVGGVHKRNNPPYFDRNIQYI